MDNMNSLSELKIFVKMNMTDIIKTCMIYNKDYFSYLCYRNTFSSISEVITHMKDLDQELSGTNMQNLIAFNHTYLIITEAVAEQLNKAYFSDNSLMEEFDIQFARYYFDALKSYIDNTKVPEAWKILFDLCKKNSSYQFVYMALGVNAHVNNDLSQSLHDIITDMDYKDDFDKVNILIRQQIPLVVASLHEQSLILETSKNVLRPIYAIGLYLLIKNWRQNAWDTYIYLKKESISIETIEKNAKTIALRIARLHKLI